jgi:hypothetical protein
MVGCCFGSHSDVVTDRGAFAPTMPIDACDGASLNRL